MIPGVLNGDGLPPVFSMGIRLVKIHLMRVMKYSMFISLLVDMCLRSYH